MSFLAKALQNPQFLQQVLQPRAPSRITSGDLTWALFSCLTRKCQVDMVLHIEGRVGTQKSCLWSSFRSCLQASDLQSTLC